MVKHLKDFAGPLPEQFETEVNCSIEGDGRERSGSENLGEHVSD